MSVFNVTISCLTVCNLPWFMELTFQIPMQNYSLQHQTLLLPPDTFTTECCSHFVPAASFLLELLVIAFHSCPVARWTPSDSWVSSTGIISFCLFICSWGSPGKNTGVGCHFFLQWTVFCQNSSLWPVCLEWPCLAWLLASLSHTSPFTMARLWSVKGCVVTLFKVTREIIGKSTLKCKS